MKIKIIETGRPYVLCAEVQKDDQWETLCTFGPSDLEHFSTATPTEIREMFITRNMEVLKDIVWPYLRLVSEKGSLLMTIEVSDV